MILTLDAGTSLPVKWKSIAAHDKWWPIRIEEQNPRYTLAILFSKLETHNQVYVTLATINIFKPNVVARIYLL